MESRAPQSAEHRKREKWRDGHVFMRCRTVSPGIAVSCWKLDLAVSTGPPVVKNSILRNFSPDCKTYSTCHPT